MIKIKETLTGRSEMTPLEAHKQSALEAKANHESIRLLHDYAFNKEALKDEDILRIKNHIESCDNCRFQINTLKKSYK